MTTVLNKNDAKKFQHQHVGTLLNGV